MGEASIHVGLSEGPARDPGPSSGESRRRGDDAGVVLESQGHSPRAGQAAQSPTFARFPRTTPTSPAAAGTTRNVATIPASITLPESYTAHDFFAVWIGSIRARQA